MSSCIVPNFHPELDYDYSIQAALYPEYCGDRTMIPNNIDLDP